MLDRNACERRVYRLATLLTGNPIAATKVITQVVGAQPDLRGLDSAHMDRLTVLRSREIKTATLVNERVPSAIADALASLTAQQREAWVLARMYRAPEREVARAMDCSFTATQRHLELADAAMTKRLGSEVSQAAKTLLAYSLSLDVPAFYRIEQRRRKYAKLTLMLAAAVIGALIIAAVVLGWGRPLSK